MIFGWYKINKKLIIVESIKYDLFCLYLYIENIKKTHKNTTGASYLEVIPPS